MKSIISNEHKCFICGRTDWIECHHIYGGANRKISEKNGFKVNLCHYCHNEPPNGVHHNRNNDLRLKQICQKEYEKTHTREEFMGLIGRNYL